jgi:hypothetical protein
MAEPQPLPRPAPIGAEPPLGLPLPRPAAPRPPRPEPLIYRLAEADLDHGVPTEYHGARLLDVMTEALRPRPCSLLLTGPNGVGKTRQAWAMVRTARRSRHARWCSAGEAIGHEWRGGRWEPSLAREDWLRRVLAHEPVRVLSEVGELRRHSHDFPWLDGVAGFGSWLVIDDVGAAPPTLWIREALYHVANVRRAWRRPTVWTTHHSPARLAELYGAAIASRVLGGPVVRLTGTDRRWAAP